MDDLRIVIGDITAIAGAAIVRAVPVGVPDDPERDAILIAGGPSLAREVADFGPLAEARPVITRPWRLPATCVINVAVPWWDPDDETVDHRLAGAIEQVMVTANRERFRHVAFSPIGPGFPMDRAAAIVVGTIYSCLFAAGELRTASIVCPTPAAFAAHEDAWLTLMG